MTYPKDQNKKESYVKNFLIDGEKTRFKKGSIPWNKGLTKETDITGKLDIISKKNSINSLGRCAWNKGLTKETNAIIKEYSIHNSGINHPMYGKHQSEESNKKNSESTKGEKNHNYGKPMSEEQKQKLRLANLGKKHTEETKRKHSESLKKHYQTPEGELHKQKTSITNKGKQNTLGHHHTEETRKKMSQKRLLQILPVEDTSIEILLQQELLKRSIEFVKHPVMYICQPDLYIPSLNIIIQADGCYWHNCPIHFPNGTRQIYDNQQNSFLTNKGYKVFRFWEHEINESVEKCIDKILIGV